MGGLRKFRPEPLNSRIGEEHPSARSTLSKTVIDGLRPYPHCAYFNSAAGKVDR